ncbi:hypothetical protein BSKO_13021 [Bryopsis sp. KO-2023]|nr:hypothetical protein BSKO_13021 [Bryopsis sp. KO-2023]
MKKITHSKRFKEFTKSSFEEVDLDGTGNLDYKELYIALLLFYDKMNGALPVHVPVPTKKEVYDYLIRFDKDQSGHLDFEEYLAVAKELFGSGRSWKDSVYFKAGILILFNMLIWPIAGKYTQKGLVKAGVSDAAKVPVAVWSFAAQGVVKMAGSALR